MISLHQVDFPRNSVVGQQRQLHFDKFPYPQSFLVWKIRFKNRVTSCSDFSSEAMLWIKEVEMVDSLDELKCSRSVSGNKFRNFEKEGQSRGTESPERGPVSTRKKDSVLDVRRLPD